jgi:hypothetical protein
MKHQKQRSEEHLIRSMAKVELEGFASNLALAREIWRRFPGLVQAERVPAAFAQALPDVDFESEYDAVVDFASPNFKEELWRYFRDELVKEARSRVTFEKNDDDFLRSMGIGSPPPE